MEEIKIYENPLSDVEYTAHSIAGLIRKTPTRYHLIDVVKEMKWGRPAEDQKMINEWIAMMELSDRGAPFSSDIVNIVFGQEVDSPEDAPEPEVKKITADTSAMEYLLYLGEFEIDSDFGGDENDPTQYTQFNDVFDCKNSWELDDGDLENIKPLEKFRDWALYTLSNINDDRTDHDGSMYEDELIIVSPNGIKYSIVDTHCMATGWNFDDYKQITLVYKDTIPPKNEKIDNKDEDGDIRI